MSPTLTFRRAWRRIPIGAAAALLLLSDGCQTWKSQSLPATTAPEPLAGHVRVTRVDGSRVEVADARVEGDTLRGERWRVGRCGERVAVGIPVDSVQRLEARGVSAGRTIGLAVGIATALFALAGLAAATVPPADY